MSRTSLGIGFTNACNLSCAHCYRPKGPPAYLTTDDVRRCLEHLDVGSANLGTGENILNPDLSDTLDLLYERGVRTSLTSNGTSLLALDEMRLRRLHDVELSVDFPTPAELDAFRGPGAWDRVFAAVDRCRGLGLKVTLLAVMMRDNHDRLAAIAKVAADAGCAFRVNVYQPVHGDAHMPTWHEFWEGFRLLFERTELVTCTEPVVAAMLAQPGSAAPETPCGCGHSSVRVTPAGELLPCVYWPHPAAHLGELGGTDLFQTREFQRCREVPRACRDCEVVAWCGGGCPARRTLVGKPDEPDPFCPYRGPELPPLARTRIGRTDLLHAKNVCTTIVRA